MRKAVRASLKFLTEKKGMDRAAALAYLSVATDFKVTKVVDKNKGIHARISKKDFGESK